MIFIARFMGLLLQSVRRVKHPGVPSWDKARPLVRTRAVYAHIEIAVAVLVVKTFSCLIIAS